MEWFVLFWPHLYKMSFACDIVIWKINSISVKFNNNICFYIQNVTKYAIHIIWLYGKQLQSPPTRPLRRLPLTFFPFVAFLVYVVIIAFVLFIRTRLHVPKLFYHSCCYYSVYSIPPLYYLRMWVLQNTRSVSAIIIHEYSLSNSIPDSKIYWLIHYILKLCNWFDGYTASIDDDYLSKFPYLENVLFL